MLSLAIILVLRGYSQPAGSLFSDADIRLEPLRVNSAASEISPAIIEGNFYFCSVRETAGKKKAKEQKNKLFYEPFTAETDNRGKVVSARKAIYPERRKYHEGPIAYCQATKELFVTLSNTLHPDTSRRLIPVEEVKLRIAIRKYLLGRWTITEELPFTDRRYHYAHPAVSSTGDTLVFSGDLPGSMGKNDLYMTIRVNGRWGDPVNLGNRINTPWNEVFPTFGPAGTLFFSSDRPAGNLGKLDIYFTDFPAMETLSNPGNKINSRFDDFGLVFSREADYGYFASNRPGRGKDDLYRFEISRTTQQIAGTITDRVTGKPVAGILVKLLSCEKNPLAEGRTGINGEFSFLVPRNLCCFAGTSGSGYVDETFRIKPGTDLALQITLETFYRVVVMDRQKNSPLAGVRITRNGTRALLTDPAGMVTLTDPEEVNRLIIQAEGYQDQFISADKSRIAGRYFTDTIWMVKTVIPEEGKVSPTVSATDLAGRNGRRKEKTSSETFFSVQIMASFQPSGISQSDFRGETSVFTIEVPPVTKYLVGRFSRYEDAVRERKRLAGSFPDAFIIGVQEGAVVSAGELRRILK